RRRHSGSFRGGRAEIRAGGGGGRRDRLRRLRTQPGQGAGGREDSWGAGGGTPTAGAVPAASLLPDAAPRARARGGARRGGRRVRDGDLSGPRGTASGCDGEAGGRRAGGFPGWW